MKTFKILGNGLIKASDCDTYLFYSPKMVTYLKKEGYKQI